MSNKVEFKVSSEYQDYDRNVVYSETDRRPYTAGLRRKMDQADQALTTALDNYEKNISSFSQVSRNTTGQVDITLKRPVSGVSSVHYKFQKDAYFSRNAITNCWEYSHLQAHFHIGTRREGEKSVRWARSDFRGGAHSVLDTLLKKKGRLDNPELVEHMLRISDDHGWNKKRDREIYATAITALSGENGPS